MKHITTGFLTFISKNADSTRQGIVSAEANADKR